MQPIVNHLHRLARHACRAGFGFAFGLVMFGGWALPAGASPSAASLETMRRDDLRVASVGYRVAVRNLALCGAARSPQPGVLLHSIGQFDAADRVDVARYFGLGPTAGVEAVVPGGPADLAGIRPGDQLVRIGETIAPRDAIPGRPSRAIVEQSYALLDDTLRRGPATITLLRRGETLKVSLAPQMGCVSRIELLSGDLRNAWADGVHIMIGGGLLSACRSDDDLAFVIAHEQAHNLLDARLGKAGAGGEKARESDADRMAVTMAAAADYDVAHALATWSAVFTQAGTSDSHPAPETRIAMLRSAATAR